ncbi:MAG: ATP-binding protein [Kofleriaceae bacterium]
MTTAGRRILIVDDNIAIHDDFKKVLAGAGTGPTELDALEAALFDAPAPTAGNQREFELASAFQGQEALAMVKAANAAGKPYALAFVDMRMPPGWDGLETIEQLWKVDPHLQIVICSAYSDHSWNELCARLGDRDNLLILKKPFDTIEVVQFAHALTAKWGLEREQRSYTETLEQAIRARTAELEEQLRLRDRMEAELRLAQRLEAIGQLAAGVAHEINTPLQYVSDSLAFARESMVTLIDATVKLQEAAGGSPAVAKIVEDADLGYLAAEIPSSFDQLEGGLARVSKIVRAMRELVHPGTRTESRTNLNHALRNALAVTAAAYKLVADVTTDFGDIPDVLCMPNDLNQVFLNLIVNAAHAMEDAAKTSRGTLGIKTYTDGQDVVILVSDTGCGIPEANRARVFDVFFTTKEVGRGTGQGLAIARSIIVDRHGGALTFETAVGRGTTFCVRLPIDGIDRAAA